MNTFSNINKYLIQALVISGVLSLTACQSTNTGAPRVSGNASEASPKVVAIESWSQSELLNAQAEMPLASGTVEEMKALGAQTAPLSEPSITELGDEGDGSMLDAQNVFDAENLPVPTVNEQPLAVGSHGAYYSSSRLIPQSARMVYPYRTVGKIYFKKQDGTTWVCSGAVIKKRLIATAGHCVHSGSNGSAGYYTDIIFIPAYSSNGTQAPYGTWSASWFKAAPAWVSGGGTFPNSADFAILEVADKQIGGRTKSIAEVVGRLGYKTNALRKNHVKMLGYPRAFDNGHIMHQVGSGAPSSGGSNTVLYGSDMTGGASGGPWVQNFGKKAVGQPDAENDGMNLLVGISSYGFVSSEPKVLGSSVLNSAFRQLLADACAHKSGNC